MKPVSFEEYCSTYEQTGRCPGDTISSGNKRRPLNERELKTRYMKYCSKLEQKELRKEKQFKELKQSSDRTCTKMIKDKRWEDTRKAVYNRDHRECQLIKAINVREVAILYSNCGHLVNFLDPAHIFGKGAFPTMKYDVDNITALNRYSHTMLDTGHCPLTGKQISATEVAFWWKRIIGEKRYEALKEKAEDTRRS